MEEIGVDKQSNLTAYKVAYLDRDIIFSLEVEGFIKNNETQLVSGEIVYGA